jgi:hypothetical protein
LPDRPPAVKVNASRLRTANCLKTSSNQSAAKPASLPSPPATCALASAITSGFSAERESAKIHLAMKPPSQLLSA